MDICNPFLQCHRKRHLKVLPCSTYCINLHNICSLYWIIQFFLKLVNKDPSLFRKVLNLFIALNGLRQKWEKLLIQDCNHYTCPLSTCTWIMAQHLDIREHQAWVGPQGKVRLTAKPLMKGAGSAIAPWSPDSLQWCERSEIKLGNQARKARSGLAWCKSKHIITTAQHKQEPRAGAWTSAQPLRQRVKCVCWELFTPFILWHRWSPSSQKGTPFWQIRNDLERRKPSLWEVWGGKRSERRFMEKDCYKLIRIIKACWRNQGSWYLLRKDNFYKSILSNCQSL